MVANTQNDDGNDTIHPLFYHTTIFLLITTVLQILSSYQLETAGPIDWFASLLIPQIASWGFMAGVDENEVGIDGKICPPDDRWVDSAFDQKYYMKKNKKLYSPDNDQRNKQSRPSLFPHCAFNRWVNIERDNYNCPAGQEYVTILHPPKVKHQSSNDPKDNRIPKILHISSPTNCLPTITIQTLHQLIHEHISQSYTIYIHSSDAIDNFLYQREWDIYPEMKEGILCGMGKLHAATMAAINELNVGNSTEQRKQIAHDISLGVKRDIWRYMILWEYGGITMDITTLHTIIEGGGKTEPSYDLAIPANNTTSDGGYNALRKLTHQWSSEISDAIIYFINNVDKQRLPYMERIPFTDMMASVPFHPLIYYSAKAALRIAIWDAEKSITDVGRTTKVPTIREGLDRVNRGWKQVKTGDIVSIDNEKKHTIHLLDGDIILPPSLTSPRTTPWKSIFEAFASSKASNLPTEEKINAMMRHFAAEQKYIAPKTMFSCMQLRLDMYLQKDSTQSAALSKVTID